VNVNAAASNISAPPQRGAVDACARLLDEAHAAVSIGRGDLADPLWRLCYGLASVRAWAPKAEWKSCVAFCRHHPVLPILHQDPYAARAYQKPRGYPGDAGIIDYLYRASPTAEERTKLTTTGQLLLQATTSTPSGFAVGERKRLAATEIDAVAAQTDRPTIIAVAAGHLREVADSDALRLGSVGRFIAIDQDQKSLDTIHADYRALGVECLNLRVLDLLQRRQLVTDADLIYALGLYDYLNDSMARRLTSALIDMLAPGGRLLVANFMPGIPEAGYMEAISDWYLTYRTSQELESLADDVDAPEMLRREAWTDDFGCIVYLRIVRTCDA
jgi:extracellular factor (EF) 3-hydroxypalmitic acid methyl ester biosynthesis protein